MDWMSVGGIILGGLFVMFALANLITQTEFDPIGTAMWFIAGAALITYNLVAHRLSHRAKTGKP